MATSLRRLAQEGGLRFRIAPGQKAQYVIALGVFREGIVTTGRPAHAYYTCLFKDIEDVLENALDEQVESLFRAEGSTVSLIILVFPRIGVSSLPSGT
jgi:hypothetical protein